MIQTLALNNGNFACMTVAEVTAVPHFALLAKDPDRANYTNQVLFTQLLQSLHRKAEQPNTAFELLFQSVPVDNQTYKAQVKMFVLVRKLGTHQAQTETAVSDLMESLKNDLENKNYSVCVFSNPQDFSDFEASLSRCDFSKKLSVSKTEKAITNALSPNGITYYNEVLEPSENINPSTLFNVLSQYPNSVVSLQIFPTQYTSQELLSIEQTNNQFEHLVSQIRFLQGIHVDVNTRMIADAYNYYSEASNEQLFLYNLVVYANHSNAIDIANKIMDYAEAENKATGSSMCIVDFSDFDTTPSNNLVANPWLLSDVLINKARNQTFWGQPNAPRHLIRLKQMMTTKELRGIFKFPIDDERIIGLESNKILVNREKLHQSVISHGNFKMGVIQNASKNSHDSATHAGIPLNDFTKHGLIVGTPGSGKTYFSLGLLLQFWNEFNIPFLAIEPTKNEYRSLIDAIPELQIFTPGKNAVSPFIINPFLPPTGVTVEGYVPCLMSAFEAAFSMQDPLPDIFLASINDCYNQYGWKRDSTKDDPNVQKFGLYEFIKVFKNKLQHSSYKGDVKANIESAGVVRSIRLIEQNPNIYDTVHSISLEDLLTKPTVIELNAIHNGEQKSLIMALLLIMICVHTKNNVHGDGKLKNVLLIDEAHVLLDSPVKAKDGHGDFQSSTVKALEDMIAEIRSFGTSIIIADQSPSKVGKSIIANTNVKVIFHLVEKDCKDMISAATNMDQATHDLMGRLNMGEALLHYGRVYAPLHIKTYNFAEKAPFRPVIEDAEIAARTSYWDTHQALLIPHSECQYCRHCRNECDQKVRLDADFIASHLIRNHLHTLDTKADFVKFLVRMDMPIQEFLKKSPSIPHNPRLADCVKIKFLRKALLHSSYAITQDEYELILKHKNFLKQS